MFMLNKVQNAKHTARKISVYRFIVLFDTYLFNISDLHPILHNRFRDLFITETMYRVFLEYYIIC